MYKLDELIDYCSQEKHYFYQLDYDFKDYPNLREYGFSKIILSTGLFKVVYEELDGVNINDYDNKYENNLNVIFVLLDVINEIYDPKEIYNMIYGMPGIFDEELDGDDESGLIDASVNIVDHSILFQYHFENEFFYSKDREIS